MEFVHVKIYKAGEKSESGKKKFSFVKNVLPLFRQQQKNVFLAHGCI